MPTSCKILVTDANQRSALAVTRSLGKLPHLHVLTSDSTASALAGSSRYAQKYFQSPSPNTAPAEYIDWLCTLAAREKIDWIFPVTEVTSQLLLMHREMLGNISLPFASYETVMSLADKWQLIQLADQADVPHPTSKLIVPDGKPPQCTSNRFPVVLKPCLSRIWTGHGWIDTAVRIANSSDELNHLCRSINYFRNYPFILQEFIPGHGAGVFALYNKGEAITFFAHNRLREKPPRGGVSVLSESVALDPQLLSMAKKLLDASHWHGVAMVEFRIAPDGAPYLMEVNTRFWGSLQLAIDSGVDFPALLLKTSMGEPVQQLSSYRTGQRLRWVLGDLDSLYLALRDQGFSLGQKLKRIQDFFTPSPGNTRHEVNRLDDLGPAWFELKGYFCALCPSPSINPKGKTI